MPDCELLFTHALARIRETFASDKIFENYLDQDANEIPVDLYLDETVSDNELTENLSELDGTI
jgi:hypothetical protein